MSLLARFKWPLYLHLAGMVCIALVLILSMMAANLGTPFRGPGETTITIGSPGRYIIWHDGDTLMTAGEELQTLHKREYVHFYPELPEGALTITRDQDNAPVTVHPAPRNSVGIGDRRRTCVAQAYFDSAGEYRFSIARIEPPRPFRLVRHVVFFHYLSIASILLSVVLIFNALIGFIFISIRTWGFRFWASRAKNDKGSRPPATQCKPPLP